MVLLFLITQIFAFEGILLERGTKKPLKEVNIFLMPEGVKVTTGVDGKFQSDSPLPQSIIINHSGYLRLDQSIKSELDFNPVYLEKENYNVFETTVTSKVKKRDESLKTMTQADFLKAPGAMEDPLKAVQNLPGMANQGSGSAVVVIQGSEPDDTKYSVNGHEIPLVFHFGGISSVLYPQSIESINFLSSGYGPEYSRAIGGIINLNTKVPYQEQTRGAVFLDLYNIGGHVEGPASKDSSYFFGMRKSHIGEVLKVALKDNEDFDLTVAPSFSDVTSIYHKKLSDELDFDMIVFGSLDTLEFVLNEPAGNDAQVRGDFFQQTEFYRFIPRMKLKKGKDLYDFSLGYGKNSIIVKLGTRYFDLDTYPLTQRFEWSRDHNDSWSSYMGLDNQFTKYNVRVNLPNFVQQGGVNNPLAYGEDRIADLEGNEQKLGAYVRNTFRFGEKKDFEFGPNIRFDSFTSVDESIFAPRVSLKKNHNDFTSTYFNTGIYYAEPQPQESSKEFGNPDLELEKAIHYTLGFNKDFRRGNSEGVTLNTNVFYKELSNLVVPSIDENFNNKGTGKIHGFETMVRFKKNEYTLAINYTYLKSLRSDNFEKDYPSEFDQTHNLNLIGSKQHGKYFFSTRLRYVTGNPYTPIAGASYDADSDVYIPERGDFFSKRYEPFVQLDFRIDRKVIYNTWILSYYLDIQNVTNSKNTQSIVYNYDYSDSQKISGLPILPIFGIKGEF
jgi:hypothetical protein